MLIVIKLPRIRKDDTPLVKKPTYYGQTHTNVTPMLPTAEFTRRNNIVVQAYESCEVKVGDIAEPREPNNAEKYQGKFRILRIARSYYEWRGTGLDTDWPKNDWPMIVDAQPLEDPKKTITATANYFVKVAE